MRTSALADKRYHHRYYMMHREKYRERQHQWELHHPIKNRKRNHMSYRNHHQHNNVDYDVPIKHCYDSGHSPAEIAKILKLSRQTVYRHCRKLGLRYRNYRSYSKEAR